MKFYICDNENQIAGFDEILSKYFGRINNGFVVDVGAFDGYCWSNSYPVLSVGWNGLLIEPHPKYCSWLRSLHNERLLSGITIVEKAISNYKGETTLYGAGSLSTIKHELIESYKQIPWAKNLNQKESFIVEVDKLDNVLQDNNVVPNFELLSIDTEGSEIEALEFFDLKYWKPKMVIIEAKEETPHAHRKLLDSMDGNFYKFCDDLFVNNGYEKIYADTVNTIYVL